VPKGAPQRGQLANVRAGDNGSPQFMHFILKPLYVREIQIVALDSTNKDGMVSRY
jgi:hypothetical protein